MAKAKVIKELLQGIGSLFKSKGKPVPEFFTTPPKDPDLVLNHENKTFFNIFSTIFHLQ